ncbi:MAG: LamG domain-containing protein [Nitrosopumilus sp.]|nr:LamG domain-containing protein [Nitrosopumilus sp.]
METKKILQEWTNGYESVYHLNDDFEDSTSNNYDATNSGTSDIVGLLTDAQDFEGSDNSDHLDLGTWNVAGDDLTIQTWAKFESFTEPSRLLSKAQSTTATDNHVYALGVDTSGLPFFYLKSCDVDSCATSVLSDSDSLQSGRWNLVTATYDGSSMRLFVNGTQIAISSESGDIRQNSWDIYAGNNPTALDRDFDGILDEIRISSNARSGNWLTAEYNNQVSSETFYSLGIPEQFGFT